MSDPLVRGWGNVTEPMAEQIEHLLAERDRYRAGLENIAVGHYPGQFKHEPDPYSAYARAVLEGPFASGPQTDANAVKEGPAE